MRALGCLPLLLLAGVLSVELWFYLLVAQWMGSEAGPELLGAALLLVGLSFGGWRLLRWHMQRLPSLMMQGRSPQALGGVLGGMLLVLPGFLSAVPGLLLQIPPVQRLCGKVLNGLVLRISKRSGIGGGAGGFPFPGGFPGAGGFPGGAFPGGMRNVRPGSAPEQLEPDDRIDGRKVKDADFKPIDE